MHAIYSDFSKAFDTVDIDILLSKLQKFGIEDSLLNWFKSYLRGRSIQVAFNGYKSSPFSPPSGVPQGSVLGPLLFNIFINDLGSKLKCDYLFYADDLKIYTCVDSLIDVVKLQTDINTLYNWCEINNLKLNIKKCKYLPFSNKHNPITASYHINNIQLEQVYSIRDLGVTFDSKLKFNEHISNIINKSYRCLGFITRITKKFNNTKCLDLLYNALVRTNLEYASTIWSPYQVTYKHSIERVQKKFTRLIYFKKGMAKVDYNLRLKHLKMISLESRRIYSDMSFLHKIIHNQINPLLQIQLTIRDISYPNRFNTLFQPKFSRTYYGSNSQITNRLQREFNKFFNNNNIDIRHTLLSPFKILILRRLMELIWLIFYHKL